MPPKSKNRHLYDPQFSKILDAIALPQKIKCGRCNMFRGQPNYSTRQLRDARMKIYEKGQQAVYKISCNKCTGQPLVELECSMCNKTKGLEDFAKNQRNKPDSAECFACTEGRLDLTPVDEEVYEDPRKAFLPAEGVENNNPDYWSSAHSARSTASQFDDQDREDTPAEGGGVTLTLVDNFRGLRVHSSDMHSRTGTLIESDDMYSHSGRAPSTGGPVQSVDDGWTVANKKSDKKPGVFDPTKYGKPQSGATPSTLTNASMNSNYTEPSDNNGKWAKIKAYKPPPKQQQVDDWESESSESEDDGDDDSDLEV
ncbi:hypothetical protein K491DRAFT_716363 [Lophiostoma macrostomum CBS 122681]|uniref:Stc1 domain-containing protein n=1 Tax=Lophiostoma macrostomum CBS 122681 TaxID=1314788 RepID=A0A6A6T8U5_9PLEO|nr:hypothetical protein K491DRAFT_716363 [Lophiostoma macrostomum CBS 122681]